MATDKSITKDNWETLFDVVETIGKIVGIFFPGQVIIFKTATEAAGFIRRNIPRLIARLADKAPNASPDITQDLIRLQTLLMQGKTVSEDLLKQLELQKRRLQSAPDEYHIASKTAVADDLAAMFGLAQNPAVLNITVRLSDSVMLEGMGSEWLPPSTLFLGGEFRGELLLDHLLTGDGWRTELRHVLLSVAQHDHTAISIKLRRDRGRFQTGHIDLELNSLLEPVQLLDRSGAPIARIAPFPLTDPICVTSSRIKLIAPSAGACVRAIEICPVSSQEDPIYVYYVQPRAF